MYRGDDKIGRCDGDIGTEKQVNGKRKQTQMKQ